MIDVEAALRQAFAKLDRMAEELGDRIYHYCEDGRYCFTDGAGWTDGLWPGQLWLAYEATGDPKYRAWAEACLYRLADRLTHRETLDHDVGFLYMPSMRAAYELTGDRAARELALLAAEHLLERQRPPGFLLAFNDWPDDTPAFRREKAGKMILDTLMNLPLLWWAADETGRSEFAQVAERHADAALRWLLRPDGSTNHTYNFDPDTWEPLGPKVWQGLRDDSCWSRGQAWAIYGFALAYAWTGASRFLEAAARAAEYWVWSAPADRIPLWDFDAADGPLDSSAAAIAASGLLELARLWPQAHEVELRPQADDAGLQSRAGEAGSRPSGDDAGPWPRAAAGLRLRTDEAGLRPRAGEAGFWLRTEGPGRWRAVAVETLASLGARCLVPPEQPGILTHGCSFFPRGWGVDCTLVYGDYFYIEALLKLAGRPRLHWR